MTMATRTTRYMAKDLAKKKAEPTALDVEPLGSGRYAVTMDGHRYELESLVLSHGAVSMIVEGHSYSVEFDARGDEVDVMVRGQVNRFDVVDERRLRLRAASVGFTAEGRQTIAAPMPGKVVKVFVKVGEAVTEGQGLVVIEAMKMENELKSPKAGTVVAVSAKEGTAVENGATLVVVE
jgi:biotin carboxyl carrier protein